MHLLSSKHTQAGIQARISHARQDTLKKAAIAEAARSIADLERAARHVPARSDISKLMESAQNRIEKARGGIMSFFSIERRICRAFDIRHEDARREKHHPDYTLVRYAIMYWSLRLTKLSAREIGFRMGGVDHSTVYHGARKYPAKRAAFGRFLPPLRFGKFGNARPTGRRCCGRPERKERRRNDVSL